MILACTGDIAKSDHQKLSFLKPPLGYQRHIEDFQPSKVCRLLAVEVLEVALFLLQQMTK